MKKTAKMLLFLVLALLLVGGGALVGSNWRQWSGQEEAAPAADVDTDAEVWTGEKEVYTGKKNEDTIDIPGFDAMTIKAGAKEQSVNLYNPPQNTCYFKMSLLLSDGTLLWESDLIEPGKAVYDLTLTEALEAGEYEDAVLKYECFAMDEEQTPLNGSEIRFTLKALE